MNRIIKRDGIKAKGGENKWHLERSVPRTTKCGTTFIKPSLITVTSVSSSDIDPNLLCKTCFNTDGLTITSEADIRGYNFFRLKTTRPSQVPKWHVVKAGMPICSTYLGILSSDAVIKTSITPQLNKTCQRCLATIKKEEV